MTVRRKTQQLKIACSAPLSGWDVMMEVRNRNCVRQLKGEEWTVELTSARRDRGEMDGNFLNSEFRISKKSAVSCLSLFNWIDWFLLTSDQYVEKINVRIVLFYHPFLMILQRLKFCRSMEKNEYFRNRLQKSLISFIYNKQRWKEHL